MEYEPQNNQPAPKVKRTAAIIIGLLLVGAIATGVVLLLKNIAPKAPQESSQATSTSVVDILKNLRTPGTVASLEKFTQQTNTSGSVIYKAEGRPYTVSVPVKESILFVAPTPGLQTTTAQGDLTDYISKQGYEKTENTGAATVNIPGYTTLKGSAGVCQIVSSQPSESQQTLAFYQVACADTTAISQEYSSLETLFSAYKENGSLPSFTSATRTTNTEDNKSYSIVTLGGDSTKTSLLFAAIDNNWEYIGNLSDSSSEANGKYSVSANMRSEIDDARWGGFLKKTFR